MLLFDSGLTLVLLVDTVLTTSFQPYRSGKNKSYEPENQRDVTVMLQEPKIPFAHI